MILKPLGDSAWLIEFPDEIPPDRVMGWVDALEKDRPAGVLDVVPSFASVAVHFSATDGFEIRKWIESVKVTDRPPTGKEHAIPVVYGREFGPDLDEVAKVAGMSTDEVIARHSGAIYTVRALGFSPGFPYLSGLPERLRIPRRGTPRLAVPAGSVAVAGGQAGIYPFTSPGGWQVLGRTGLSLFDPSHDPPSLLLPGDRVRFVPADEWEPAPEKFSTMEDLMGSTWIEVIEPGGLTSVQDLGRPGYQSSGVSPGGAADRHALRMANLLVGNDQGAAALELTIRGLVLRFHGSTTVALTGMTGRPRMVADGEIVDFSNLPDGVRAYLSVAGGIVVKSVLGSSSTDLRAGFGGHDGRALKSGDRLAIGNPGCVPGPGDWHAGRADKSKAQDIELRFIPGVQECWFSEEARRRFREKIYQLAPNSDRMGARMSGAKLELEVPREMVSQPVACGSVQVPPDGQPIVLLAGRQTIGGYPQIGHVISVDLPKLARAWPGTPVHFREVSLDEAWELRQRAELDLKWLRTGLNLL